MYEDALKFYKAVLPPSGVYYLAQIKKGFPAFHKPYTSIEDMVAALGALDADPNYDLYHACSSYLNESVEYTDKDGKVKKAWRHNTNRDSAKAFWIDVDVGEAKAAKGDGYLTKNLAFAAVKDFCTKIGLPQPAVVDSGNGLHFYWPLTKAIPHTKWVPVATAFKAVLAHYGVLADPTRTADFVSILRTPGTTNKKDPENPKTVQLKRMVDPIEPSVFWEAVKAQVSNCDLKSQQVSQKTADINDELAAHAYAQIDCSAITAANKCAQMAAMRDTQGDVGYEHWFGVIGVIKHCVEGVDLALEWSERREETGHSQCNTQYKFDTWNSGPTTCSKLYACNPDGCLGCEFKGKITSPIQLGRIVPVGEEKTLEVEQVDGKTVAYEIPALPDGFAFDGQVMSRTIVKDEIPITTVFCNELFYLTQHIRDTDGTYKLNVRHHHSRNGKVSDFQITAEETAAERELTKALIRNSVLPIATKESGMSIHAYVRSSFERLKRETDEVHTYDHFGWHDNYSSFLIGDRMFCAGGVRKKVLLSAFAADAAMDFPEPVGTLEGYTMPFNYIYAREGMEPMQYYISSSWGALLAPFAEQLYHGVMCAVTGGDTAKGKTTAAYAGMYALGDADRMTVATKKGATLNARYRKLGTYRNLPALFDELTDLESAECSELVYAISNGKEKERLSANPSGVRKAIQAIWDTAVLATANRDLHATLAEDQANSQAEAVRLLQINVDNYALPKFEEGEVAVYLQQMARNQGVAGELFIQHLVDHVDVLPSLVAKWVTRTAQTIAGQKYRFFRAHVGCTMAAAEIMIQLGIAKFDIEALFAFVVDLMNRLSTVVSEQNTLTPKVAFSQMLNEFGPRILTTQGYRDTRDARGPEQTRNLNVDPVGRWIQGAKDASNPLGGRVYLNKKYVREWCMQNRVEPGQVMAYADEIGVLIHEKDDRFTIGRGTQHLTGNTRCVALDFDKFQAMTQSPPAAKPKLATVRQNDESVSKSGTEDV